MVSVRVGPSRPSCTSVRPYRRSTSRRMFMSRVTDRRWAHRLGGRGRSATAPTAFVLALILSSGPPPGAIAGPRTSAPAPAHSAGHHSKAPRQVLVQFRPGTTDREQVAITHAAGASVQQRLLL